MAKLTRVPAKVFAASAAADEIGQFGSAVAGSKLETADVATIQGLSAWLDGWSEALVSGNRYPSLQEMNGLLKVLSYQGAYALQEGIPEYDASTTYYIGSIVKKTGTFELYGSLTNDNVGNALTVGASWKFLCDLNAVGQNITQIGTCSTVSATAEKAVTLSGFVLTTGATIQVTFTNANTSSTITLNVNSLGAKNIYDMKGNQITGSDFNNATNETCLFTYNGTNWILVTAPFWESRMASISNSIITVSSTTGTQFAVSSYQAPADGYFSFDGILNTSDRIIAISVYADSGLTTLLEISKTLYNSSAINTGISIRVKKGNYIRVSTNTGITFSSVTLCQFVYTEGSKP